MLKADFNRSGKQTCIGHQTLLPLYPSVLFVFSSILLLKLVIFINGTWVKYAGSGMILRPLLIGFWPFMCR